MRLGDAVRSAWLHVMSTQPKKERQVPYALHISSYIDRIMAFGTGHFLHHGRFDPCSSGHRPRSDRAGIFHRAKNYVTFEGST